ncbi:MAG TPA: hypothetical protein VKE42_03435 [Candidatus Cybelea sp.]|nr:hypothetical protein [Candidatus Cybelea sp.]
MATLYSALIAGHVILTTFGYVGLIATNAYLLLLFGNGDAAALAGGVRTWRRAARIFGPTLGLGILAGFGLAIAMHTPLGTAWLVVTYALIVIVLAVQATVMVPWQLRANAAIGRGEMVSTRPVALVLSLGCVAYIAIITLMLLRP